MKRLLALLLLLGVSTAQEPAGRPQDLASLVPAETLLLVQGDDLGGIVPWSQNTALGRIWAEPEMQGFLLRLGRSIDAAAAQGLGMLGLQPGDLDGIEIRSGGLAVVDAGVLPAPFVDLVFTLRFRAGADKAGKVLLALKQAVEAFTPFAFEQVELSGREVWAVRPMGVELLFSMHQDRFVLTTSRARMEHVLGALDEGHPSPLAKAARFVEARGRMGAEPFALLGYLDVPGIYRRALEAWPPAAEEANAVWKGLGLDAVKAVACADVPAGTGFRTELAITLRDRRGVFALPLGGRVDHRFAKYAPEGCLLYAAETADLAAVLDWALGLMDRFEPGTAKQVDDLVRRYNEALGIDLEEDLLKSLGDRWAWFAGAPPGGGLVPDVALFVTVKDREKVDRALVALASRVKEAAALHGEKEARRAPHVSVHETQFRGRTIRFAEITDDRGEPVPVAPAWAFGDDFLVIGLFPHTVRNVFTEKRALDGNEEFRRLQRLVPESVFSSTYLDTRGLVVWLANTLTPVLQGVQGAINRSLAGVGVRVNFEDLPSAEVYAKHLTGTMFYEAVEDSCFRMGYVSPFGFSLALAPVAAGMAAGILGGVREPPYVVEIFDEEPERAARADLEQRVREMEREIERLRRLLEEEER